MTGLDTVVQIRRRGLKPKAVFIDLVQSKSNIVQPLSEHGIVNIEIVADEQISCIDFRPLVGLSVHVYDNTASPKRHRRVAAMVAAIAPSLLVVPVPEGSTWTVHRRFANGTSDRTTL